jgi:hypothetical protein
MAVAEEVQDYSAAITEPAPASTPALSRTEQAKSKLLAHQHRQAVVESLEKAGAMPPPNVDLETGEILPADPVDPITDLILAISECQSKEELEVHRGDVAILKNGLKKRAVEAWKAAESRVAA